MAAAARRAGARGKSTMTPERQLQIKIGVLKRTSKDLTAYQKEVETERARLDKLVTSGADESDQTHQHAVIEEAASMIPDTLGRIEAAASDLEAFLDAHRTDEGIAGSAALKEATELIHALRDDLEEEEGEDAGDGADEMED